MTYGQQGGSFQLRHSTASTKSVTFAAQLATDNRLPATTFQRAFSRSAHWVRPPKTQQPRPRNSLIPRHGDWRQGHRSRWNVISKSASLGKCQRATTFGGLI